VAQQAASSTTAGVRVGSSAIGLAVPQRHRRSTEDLYRWV